MSVRRWWFAFPLICILALAAGAEDDAADAGAAETSGPAPSPLLHGVLELSLGDAIRMGLENNLDVQVERYSPLIAEYNVDAAWGAYDPTAFGEFSYENADLAVSSAFQGDELETLGGLGGVRGIVPVLSTELSAQFDTLRTETNSIATTLSPDYASGWSIDLRQPLLRDLIWSQPWTQVRTSKLVYRASEEDFRRATMDEVQQIENAYWDLIAAGEALRVSEKSLEAASALLEQTETQYEVGVVSRVEVTEAKAGVSQREVERIRAENQYRNQQDVLIDLVLGPNLRATSSLEIRPTDQPDDFVPYTVDVEQAVERAFEYRPELASALREMERREVQQSFARNQMLPELDALFGFGQGDLAGRINPDAMFGMADPERLGGFDDSVDDFNDFPQYRAGARISIPFPNRTARSNASISELEFSRARTTLRRLEQQIIIEVRQAARNLLASQEGITAARAAREAAEEQLRAEEIRLEYGESTPFDVLQREEDLVEREREEIGAFQAYRNSVTALDRAQGTLLRNRNIQIADVAPLR